MRSSFIALTIAAFLSLASAASAEAPKNVTPPSIVGTAQVGQTLTAEHGTWEPTPSKYTYSWQRCNASAAECAYIEGAGASTYTLISTDLGHTMKALVAAWNTLNQFNWLTAGPTAVVAAAAAMRVGIDSGGWLLTNDTALMAGKKLTLRSADEPTAVLTAYESHAFPSIDLVTHHNEGGIAAVNAEAFATEVLERAQAHPGTVASELENEPGNPFQGWGSNAWSKGNAEAYAALVNTVANRFVTAYSGNLSAMPKLLWSADGGYKGAEWASWVWPLLNTNARTYGRPTAHPYGGNNEAKRAESALGGRKRVEEIASITGEKEWITEVGWPTCVGCEPTGDSLQWTQAEQAANIKSFIEWAPAYAEDVTIFQYRDYSPNNYYGIETSTGTHKPSYETVQTLAP